jgi:hypothetical protein
MAPPMAADLDARRANEDAIRAHVGAGDFAAAATEVVRAYGAS